LRIAVLLAPSAKIAAAATVAIDRVVTHDRFT
jgi:hypothetical protein